jgi:predicted nucleic acid-binding protein
MIFFDTTYLARLYLDDPGADHVRALVGPQPVASSWHAQAELLCTFHRAFREGRLDEAGHQAQREQFAADQAAALFQWLPVGESTLRLLDRRLAAAPSTLFLRAADALHLACAAEHGFTEVYSNDRHFLLAASYFGLQGRNVLRDSP